MQKSDEESDFWSKHNTTIILFMSSIYMQPLPLTSAWHIIKKANLQNKTTIDKKKYQ